LMLLGLTPVFLLAYQFWPGASFANYRNQIEVLEPKLTVNESTYDGVLTLGQLHNHSPLKWKDVIIEVQYFDADDRLVGTAVDKIRDLVLLPDTIHAFQLSSKRLSPVGSYVKQKIYLRDAIDGRKWP